MEFSWTDGKQSALQPPCFLHSQAAKTLLGIPWACHIQSLDPASASQPLFHAFHSNPDIPGISSGMLVPFSLEAEPGLFAGSGHLGGF